MALKGMGQLLNHFSACYLEVNKLELYKGCGLVPDIDQFLSGFGFTRVKTKWTKNGWGEALYIKKQVRRPWFTRTFLRMREPLGN